jgi:hypothetical protein
MTERGYIYGRMDRSLDQAIDMAEEKAEDRGVVIPDSIIGQMAIQMFQAKLSIAMSDTNPGDLPEDTGWGSY